MLPAQGALQGDMPRAKQMGYLFGEPSARTVAHELMHGVFKLEHTFSSTYGVARGSTTNLMDYPPAGGQGGATLIKHQWDYLFSSGVVIGIFEKEEDGAYIAQIAQCLGGAAIDFALYYRVTWVSMFFDDAVTTVPNCCCKEAGIY